MYKRMGKSGLGEYGLAVSVIFYLLKQQKYEENLEKFSLLCLGNE